MSQVLLLELSECLRLASTSGDAPTSLRAFGNVYDEVVLGREGFLGFYDWLRAPSGELVGLRLSIDSRASALAPMIPDASYIVRETNDVVRIMFTPTEDIDWEASMDQDFGRTRVYRNQGAGIVLSIDAEGLTGEEFANLGGVRPIH